MTRENDRINNVNRSLRAEARHYVMINPSKEEDRLGLGGSLPERQDQCDLIYVKIHAVALQIKKMGVSNIVSYMLKEHAERCAFDVIIILKVVVQTAFKVIRQGSSELQKMKKAKAKAKAKVKKKR